MKSRLLSALFITITVIFFTSCNKEDAPTYPVINPTTGLYVLCEGNYGSSNSTLGYYDFATSSYATDFYKKTNATDLGDNANSAVIYGSKLYIAIDNSGYVAVLNAATGKLIKSISFKLGEATKNPRRVIAANGKIYVPTYSKTVDVIDTSSLEIVQSFKVRSAAEDIAVRDNQLYVSLQGYYTDGYDSIVVVLNANDGSQIKSIKVGYSPGRIVADNKGNIFVSTMGNYADIKPTIVKASVNSGALEKVIEGSFGKLLLYNNQLFCTGGYNGFAGVRIYNPDNMELINKNFTSGTNITMPYGINIDEENGDVYVTDAIDNSVSGKVFAFDKTGKLRFSFSTGSDKSGVSPSSVLLKR